MAKSTKKKKVDIPEDDEKGEEDDEEGEEQPQKAAVGDPMPPSEE